MLYERTCNVASLQSLQMQGKLYMIMEICRTFDQIFKEHLDGVYVYVILNCLFCYL